MDDDESDDDDGDVGDELSDVKWGYSEEYWLVQGWRSERGSGFVSFKDELVRGWARQRQSHLLSD